MITSKEATEKSRNYLEYLGCKNGLSNAELLECAKNMDAKLILNKTSTTFFVIENDVFHKSIYELSQEKAFKKCNIITGFNTEEYTFFAPFLGILPLDKPTSWEDVAKSIDFKLFSQYLSIFHFNDIQKNEKFLENALKQYMTSTQINNPDLAGVNYFNYLNKIETGKKIDICFTQLLRGLSTPFLPSNKLIVDKSSWNGTIFFSYSSLESTIIKHNFGFYYYSRGS